MKKIIILLCLLSTFNTINLKAQNSISDSLKLRLVKIGEELKKRNRVPDSLERFITSKLKLISSRGFDISFNTIMSYMSGFEGNYNCNYFLIFTNSKECFEVWSEWYQNNKNNINEEAFWEAYQCQEITWDIVGAYHRYCMTNNLELQNIENFNRFQKWCDTQKEDCLEKLQNCLQE